jgi:carboxyl-terminal processing protease
VLRTKLRSNLSSFRFFLVALSVLAVGVTLYLSRSYQDASKIKSAEDYWAETGLGPASLEDLIQDQVCGSSERYFLACTNALLSVANRYNLSVTHQGHLVDVAAMSADINSEKTQLETWRTFFTEQTGEAMKLPFMQAWDELKSKHISSAQMSMMVGIGLNGFISVFRDPHTYLMPVEQFKEVVSKVDNKSQSLGLVLGRANGHYVVRKVLPGSPAQSAGLLKGDVVAAIDATKIKGLLQARVSELLKGDLGSEVDLAVLRAGHAKTISVTRAESMIPTVSGQVIDGIKPVGVITLNKFAKSTCEKTKSILTDLKKAQVRGLLLDLRDNPGGQMEEAACVASLFVGPKEKIFELRYLDPGKAPEVYYGSEEKVFDLPMAVLMNASSASAAEIVAGALRDLNRAVLVGEKTFGKGSFQEGELWSQNRKIALFETKGFYYLPTGRSPQLKGLNPDVAVHFDNIFVGREEDQFLNPLRAPEHTIRNLGRVLSSADCLELQDGSTTVDKELLKARQILFCSKTAIGANQ